MAFLAASHAMDKVVRFDGRICGVSPTPTMQYLSVSAPIVPSLCLHLLPNFLNEFPIAPFVLALRGTKAKDESV